MTDVFKYQLVLGFEIHVELSTQSKMFCGCPADHFGKEPNTQTCPVCLGLPGALPVPNSKAIEDCIKLGLSLDCQINKISKFDRKNYFYPDLPKGYQISQYDQPFCISGKVILSDGKTIHITRVHMEEDTGKLQHTDLNGEPVTLVDFNRSGVPLVEIVTEPDFSNADDGIEFLKEIQQIVRFLGISSADMERGSMRLEANISVRPYGQTFLPSYKVEVKNVNSFRFIKKAIQYEYQRQSDLLSQNQTPVQETRGFNEGSQKTFSQRLKEQANDYRYFPEPDIPPIEFSSLQIDKIKSSMPILPVQVRQILQQENIPVQQASLIAADISKYNMYKKLIHHGLTPKEAVDAIINIPGDLSNDMNNILSWINSRQKIHTDNSVIKNTVDEVLKQNPKAILDYKSGKSASLFFIIGQVKNKLGNIDVNLIKEFILESLK